MHHKSNSPYTMFCF